MSIVNFDVFEYIVDKYNVNIDTVANDEYVNIDTGTCLYWTINTYNIRYESNEWKLINFCIKKGADVNYVNQSDNKSCLQAAKDKNLVNVVELLIKNGAK